MKLEVDAGSMARHRSARDGAEKHSFAETSELFCTQSRSRDPVGADNHETHYRRKSTACKDLKTKAG